MSFIEYLSKLDVAFYGMALCFLSLFMFCRLIKVDKYSGPSISEDKGSLHPSDVIYTDIFRRYESVRNALKGYKGFSSLIKYNLDVIVEDGKNAAVVVLGNLSAIRTLFSNLTDYVYRNGEEARMAAAQATACVVENKELLIGIKIIWAKRDMELAEYKKWLISFIDGAKNYQNRLTEIETISSRFKALSKNAAVGACNSSNTGQKYEALAREADTLASQLDKIVSFITVGISNLEQNITQNGAQERLTGKGESQSKKYELDMFDQLYKKIFLLGDMCSRLTQHHENFVKEIDQINSSISNKILQSLADIQFQDKIARQIETVQRALNKSNMLFDQCVDALAPDSTTMPELTMTGVIDSIRDEYLEENKSKNVSAPEPRVQHEMSDQTVQVY